MEEDVFFIDKPAGFSSFQVVRILKRRYKKVGHAGTLDPFASGLLIILTGSATKQFSALQGYDKEYVGEIIFGFSTDTYDITGKIQEYVSFTPHLSLESLNSTAQYFVGEIEQTPPGYSAIKQNGQKLYQLSRKGKHVEPKSRKVSVKTLLITRYRWPCATFRTIVGKGTYIRSLTHDIGVRLGCRATLMTLRRVRIGPYDVNAARKIGYLLNFTKEQAS
jgi:tRNA pseudouridine55 synthase